MKRLPLLLALWSSLHASSPAFWELSSFPEFLKGKFHQISLSRDGTLSAAPALTTWFESGQAYLWSLSQADDGTLYAGTGNQGRLYRINPSGKGELLWTAPQPEIFAVAAGPPGVVYAGTSPNGRIYRIENGKAAEYFNPKAQYIWSLAIGRDGALYAGTGIAGKIFRISSAGQGEEYFLTGQTNVTSLRAANDGSLLAGTEPNGVLYRITAKDKAFALYDANLPEIRAMAEGPEGAIYATALGGAVARKAQSAVPGAAATPADTPTITTSITVTADAAAELKPPEPPKPTAPPAAAAPATPATTAVEVAGVERTAIYRINRDNTVDTLWSSKEENVYDLVPTAGGLLFATDTGHVYRLDASRRLTLVAQTNQGDLNRLLLSGGMVLAAAGSGGRIFRLGSQAEQGTYESPVFDAGSIARWGHMRRAGSGTATLWTRSGNSLRPDATWSAWISPRPGGQIESPNARYFAWKADLPPQATIASVSVGYLPQNNPPLIRSFTALTTLQPAPTPAKTANGSAATPSYSITVTDTGDAGPTASSGTAVQTLSRAATQQLILSWQAEDPDGDRLIYDVAFRGEDERLWKPLRQNLHENTVSLDAESLPDGRYYFRVIASDREANAGSSARDAELVSAPVLIDNTPPRVAASPLRGRELDWSAVDSTSPLKRAEYAIDGMAWIPADPVAGILDTKEAHFHLSLGALPPGEHVVVLRALDQANNSGQTKVVLP